jgi:hypothetical protein
MCGFGYSSAYAAQGGFKFDTTSKTATCPWATSSCMMLVRWQTVIAYLPD